MPLFGRPNVDRLKKKRAVKKLIKALAHQDVSVRKSAAEALGDVGDTRAVEPLLLVLNDKDEDVRSSSARALGKIGDARAVVPLLAVLKEENRRVQKWAVSALGRIGDARAVVPLLAVLKDEDSGVRTKAVEALGRIGDARAVEPLKSALNDDNNYVRRRAVWALEELGVKPAELDSQQAKARKPRVVKTTPALVAGNVLAMAIVYEGRVIEEPEPLGIARELLTGFSEAGVLTGVTLHPLSGIRIRRADESAWYSGNYEPGEEMPQMLNEGIGDLRDRILAAGQTMGQVNARTVQLKGRSRVVSTC